ncbi:MAG TPA: MMPL family transporter [Paludibacter sp.]|nr:MMPL family transporter [Paludibacter sp.]
MPRLKTEVNFKHFLPKDEPELVGYETFTNKMGSSEYLMVLALEHFPSVFDSLFLERVSDFQKKLHNIKGIVSVTSLLTLENYKQLAPGFILKYPYLHVSSSKRIKDSTLIYNDFLVTQHFISRNATILKLQVRLQDSISLAQTDTVIGRLDEAAKLSGISAYHILGRKYMESEYKKVVSNELKSSIVLSILFVILILALLHRSVAGVVLPLVCMITSLIMLYGYLALFHRPLTVMSNLFPTIILIVGISDVIHISSKFAYESRFTSDSSIAIEKTLREIGLVTLLNSLTTAGGFLTLLTVNMLAIQSFGVDAAVGLMIAWVNSVTILPAILSRFNLSKSFSEPVESKTWNHFLTSSFGITRKYPRLIMSVLFLLLGISFVSFRNINTNNKVLSGLPSDHRLKNDYEYFDRKLNGGRSFEMIITTVNHHTLYEKRTITEIGKLERYLSTEANIPEIISPVTLFKWLNNSVNNQKNWQLPEDQPGYDKLSKYTSSVGTNLLGSIMDSSGTTGRLLGRNKDIGRQKMDSLDKAVNKWISRNIDQSVIRLNITGMDYITDIGHRLRIENMTKSFFIEILFVSIVIGLFYRSWLLIILSFVVNIIPVLLTAGILGFTDFELRGTTTIVFSIGYVIAVDAGLHFINRFQLEKWKKKSTAEALEHTYMYTGRAMVMTSLILLGGFLILLHSAFGDIYVHGLLMSLIIFTSMLTELFVTPVLLNFFYRKK